MSDVVRLLLAAMLFQAAGVSLSPALEEWKREIEEAGATKVVLVRVYTDPERNEMILPEDAGQRPVLRRFFLEESFRGEFAQTHGMTLNYDGVEGRYSFVLLNMALAAQWEGAEEAAIAHEFGHAWLAAQGYGTPEYEGGARSCIAIHAADTVQHVLIREELRRRDIDYLGYWKRNLEAALKQLESQPAESKPLAPCRRLALLALWLDVSLGLTAEQWDLLPRFRAEMERSFPELRAIAKDVEENVRAADLRERNSYGKAMEFTLARFREAHEAVGDRPEAPETWGRGHSPHSPHYASHPHPIFSPAGRRIYFNVNAGRWTELYVAERPE